MGFIRLQSLVLHEVMEQSRIKGERGSKRETSFRLKPYLFDADKLVTHLLKLYVFQVHIYLSPSTT